MLTLCKIEPQLRLSGLHSFFVRNCPKDFIFSGESHDFHEVVCVLKGSVGITAGTNVLTLSEGNAIWHPPMEFHSIRAAEGTAPIILVFSFTAETFPALKNKVFSFTAADEALLHDAMQLDHRLFDKENYRIKLKADSDAFLAQQFMETLSLFLLRVFTNNADTNTSALQSSTHTYSVITSYIKDHLPNITCVEQIAKACKISTVGVQKLFQKYAGIGAMHYVNHLKITRAIEMLRQGKTSKETALLLGFSNQNYFSTVFKRITGSSPTQYLKRN